MQGLVGGWVGSVKAAGGGWADGAFPLVPKLGLGMRLRGKLCFGGGRLVAGGRAHGGNGVARTGAVPNGVLDRAEGRAPARPKLPEPSAPARLGRAQRGGRRVGAPHPLRPPPRLRSPRTRGSAWLRGRAGALGSEKMGTRGSASLREGQAFACGRLRARRSLFLHTRYGWSETTSENSVLLLAFSTR